MSGMINIKVTGSSRVRRSLRKWAKLAPDAVAVAMFKFGEVIMDASVDMAPRDTGELRESAYVAPPKRRGFFQIVELGYGAEHAPKVHEQTERSYRNGQPKYLEKALAREARGRLRDLYGWTLQALSQGRAGPPARGRYPGRPK